MIFDVGYVDDVAEGYWGELEHMRVPALVIAAFRLFSFCEGEVMHTSEVLLRSRHADSSIKERARVEGIGTLDNSR